MLSDSMITAGNPVIIRLNYALVARAILNNKWYLIRETLQHSLEVASKKMLRTLAVVPVADVIAWDKEIKRWRKMASESVIMPNKLDRRRVIEGVTLTAFARDKLTGKSVSVKGMMGKDRVEDLQKEALQMLSDLVLKVDRTENE